MKSVLALAIAYIHWSLLTDLLFNRLTFFEIESYDFAHSFVFGAAGI